MKTIVVATDFSPDAYNATLYAAELANAINANLLLFNVYEVIPNYGEIVFDVSIDDLKASAESDILEIKTEIVKRINPNIEIATEVRLGVFEDELVSVCERINPYAVVMGSQGKTPSEHLLMGSHAGKPLKDFVWPIITVPATAKYAPINKMGIAYDFEEKMSNKMIENIKLFANDLNASIVVLNAENPDEFKDSFINYSRILQSELKPMQVEFHFIESKEIESGILSFVNDNNIDLLVAMPHHYNFFQRLFHKSHSKQLVLHSNIPVMLLNK